MGAQLHKEITIQIWIVQLQGFTAKNMIQFFTWEFTPCLHCTVSYYSLLRPMKCQACDWRAKKRTTRFFLADGQIGFL